MLDKIKSIEKEIEQVKAAIKKYEDRLKQLCDELAVEQDKLANDDPEHSFEDYPEWEKD